MSKRLDLSYDDNITIATMKDSKLTAEQPMHDAVTELIDLVSSQEHRHVVVNFEGVTYLGTSFLSGLIAVKKAAATHGTKLKLCGFSEVIMEAIHLVAFPRIFDIYPNKAAAVQAFRS